MAVKAGLEPSHQTLADLLLTCLKSLGPIDRKFHGHGETMDLSRIYIIKQCSSFCKYKNISVMKNKCQIK